MELIQHQSACLNLETCDNVSTHAIVGLGQLAYDRGNLVVTRMYQVSYSSTFHSDVSPENCPEVRKLDLHTIFSRKGMLL